MSKHDRKTSDQVDQKYGPLKKLVKRSFSNIISEVKEGRLPSVMVVEDFMAQAKAMVSYSGFGDERYPVFIGACEGLREAYGRKDLELFSKRLAEISTIKKECHRLYK